MIDIAYPLDAIIGSTPGMKPVTADEMTAHEFDQPGFGRLFGAAFRTENMVGSMLAREDAVDPYRKQDGFDWNARYKGLPEAMRVDHGDQFIDIHNDAAFDQKQREIERQLEDKRLLAMSGWRGTVAAMTAGIVDLPTLIPAGGEYMAAARGIKGVGLAAARFAAENAAAQAVQEAGLYGSQETRTGAESAINIGAGAILGLMLGGAGAALLSRGERAAAEGAVARILGDGAEGEPGKAVSAGAAAADKLTREELSADGAVGSALTNMARINPNNRLNTSASVAAREIGQELGDNAIYQTMHAEGKTVGASVETLARANAMGRMADGLGAHEQIWKDYRKANGAWMFGRGNGMTAAEFDDAVGKAMRNGDKAVDGNEYVTRAAQSWREKVFDPLKKEAIDAGLLDKDVSVETADTYLHRWWNKQALMQNEREVKSTFADWMRGVLAEDYKKSADATLARLAKIDTEIADIQLSPSARLAEMSSIDRQLLEIEGRNPDLYGAAEEISQLRAKIIAARKSGDAAGLESSNKRIAEIKGVFGKPLSDFMQKRAGLFARRRNVDLGHAGLQERSDAILDRLAEIDAANMRSIERAIEKGRKVERELQKIDPAKLEAAIDDARSMFDGLITKASITAERAEKALDELRLKTEGAAAGAKSNISEGKIIGDADAKAVGILERDIKRQRAFAEKIESVRARLDRMEAFDREAAVAEIKRGVDALVAEISNASLNRGERAQRLLDRASKLTPDLIESRVKKLKERKMKIERTHSDQWEIGRGGYGGDLHSGQVPDFADAAEDAAKAVYDKLTGRTFDEATSDLPDWIVPVARGPLKERTFGIPDAMVEKYLHSNIRDVAQKYARTMAADVEMTRKFGRADLRDQIQRIVSDYEDMRGKVQTAKTVEEIRAVVGNTPGVLDAAKAKMGKTNVEAVRSSVLAALQKGERSDLEDIKALRDLVRGSYGRGQNETFKRISNAATAYNYLRLMGGNVIANMSELYRPAMVHGLLPYFRDGILPLVTNLKAIKMSVEEAQKVGLVVERTLHSRLMSLAEVGDRYAENTAFERLLQNGTKIASRWNGILHFTDFNQAVASVLTQDRMINAMMKGKEGRYLAYLGIDENMAGRIAKQLEKHAENIDGVWVAHTNKWDDPSGAMVRAYGAALRKDVDSTIVTRSAGDVPIFANSPAGKMLLQFKTFNLAAHQRVLIRATQESPANFVSGLVGMTSLGIMASYLRALRGGEDRWKKFEEAAKNPGYLIGEGLDLSGLFTLGFEPANITEKVTKYNPIKDPLKGVFGDTSVGESQRYASRGVVASFLGPSASAIDTMAEIAQRASRKAAGGSTDANDVALMKQGAQMLPFYSYYGPREVLNMLIGH